MSATILIVGRDTERTTLANVLTNRGYEVRVAHEMDTAIKRLNENGLSLIIADLDTTSSGPDMCRHLRRYSTIPILAVSQRQEESSEVAALDAGADDYLSAPWGQERLLARVRVALRRDADASDVSSLSLGVFHIDFNDRRVRVHGQVVRLTPKEFDLFVFMARRPNCVIPHRMLLEAVWGESSSERGEYLRVFVGQLRKKLELEPSRPRHLVTEPWVGYRFNPAGTVQ
jgi:two-component system KDP operon response regulator KdpE